MSLRRSFKVPQLKRSISDIPGIQNLALFDCNDLSDHQLIGNGSFGMEDFLEKSLNNSITVRLLKRLISKSFDIIIVSLKQLEIF